MATVYKLELEIVSHWVNYDPKLLEKTGKFKQQLKKIQRNLLK